MYCTEPEYIPGTVEYSSRRSDSGSSETLCVYRTCQNRLFSAPQEINEVLFGLSSYSGLIFRVVRNTVNLCIGDTRV